MTTKTDVIITKSGEDPFGRHPKEVLVLGTAYSLEFLTSREDPGFKRHPGAGGFCDTFAKRIVIRKPTDMSVSNSVPTESLQVMIDKTLRHEIVHAFLFESGLDRNAAGLDKIVGPWAVNEEMVDWIALQGPKICAAWREANCAG